MKGDQVPFKLKHLSPLQKIYNDIFKVLRVSIEQSFGWICRYWAFVDSKKSQIIGSRPVATYYLAAAILTNCHTCLYSHQIAHFFECSRPTLDEYLSGRG